MGETDQNRMLVPLNIRGLLAWPASLAENVGLGMSVRTGSQLFLIGHVHGQVLQAWRDLIG